MPLSTRKKKLNSHIRRSKLSRSFFVPQHTSPLLIDSCTFFTCLLHFGISTSVKLQENCSLHLIAQSTQFTSNLKKVNRQSSAVTLHIQHSGVHFITASKPSDLFRFVYLFPTIDQNAHFETGFFFAYDDSWDVPSRRRALVGDQAAQEAIASRKPQFDRGQTG